MSATGWHVQPGPWVPVQHAAAQGIRLTQAIAGVCNFKAHLARNTAQEAPSPGPAAVVRMESG
jgi:hypothetical protein